ncbi:MAG: tetratricopeptide repeat protein [Acidocella sp.]|uniref:tetratricopeptide repeat protein n=1 Tax=Acidocella sp. TaxID=50710 RepID=UPI003FBDA080
MATDYLGNEITARNPATIAAINDFIRGVLGYELIVTNILTAADAEEDTLANTYAALLWLLSETGREPVEARTYIARAEAGAARANVRELATLRAVKLWAEGDPAAAEAETLAELARNPRDLVLLKYANYLQFSRGDAPAMLRSALISLPVAGDVAHLHGILAFAYEQSFLVKEAEAAARRALALQPDEGWAQHALAHVLLTTGRVEEGIAFLEPLREGWNKFISFLYTHLWWHLALFYLAEGRFEEALEIYDRHVWAKDKSFSQDQIGAVSLLARLEFAGADVGGRWAELGQWLAARKADIAQPFLSVQYLYGLARAGQPEAEELLAAIRTAPQNAPVESREAWSKAGVTLAEGLLAHARGDYASAAQKLEPATALIAGLGGSHAQRGLFHIFLVDSLIKGGQPGRAQLILERQRAGFPDDVPLNRKLAGIYTALNLPAQAEAARARAEAAAQRFVRAAA